MANRVLARANDAQPEILEDGEPHNVGMWEEVTIERSAAGAPGLLFVITRYESSMEYDQMCVSVPDGVAFLAPVNAWLNGNDPEPWVWFGTNLRTSIAYEGEGLDFQPRPAYNQDRNLYAPRIPTKCVCGELVHSAECRKRGHLRGPEVASPKRRNQGDELRDTFEADLRRNGTINVLALDNITRTSEHDRLGMAFRMGYEAGRA